MKLQGWGMVGLLAALPLGAGDSETFMGARVHLSVPLGEGLHRDVHGHCGTGLGLVAGLQFSDVQALRLAFDYTGTHVTSWNLAESGNPGDCRRFRDIWRAFRLGAEHVLQTDGIGDAGVFVFYGAGVQEAWVNRTEGSYFEAFLLGLTATSGGAQGTGDVHLSSRATALDRWTPYAVAGVGARLGRAGTVEARFLACRYARDGQEGLRTSGLGPVERGLGRQLILSWGMGF